MKEVKCECGRCLLNEACCQCTSDTLVDYTWMMMNFTSINGYFNGRISRKDFKYGDVHLQTVSGRVLVEKKGGI